MPALQRDRDICSISKQLSADMKNRRIILDKIREFATREQIFHLGALVLVVFGPGTKVP